MMQLLYVAIGAIFGAAAGGYATWKVAKAAARNEARRHALVQAGTTLQDYRVAYAQWFVEYLSPAAQSVRGHWAKPTTEQPDPLYLQLQSAVDKSRGTLRVITGLLYALFPQEDIKPVCVEITKILMMTGDPPADCREVDRAVHDAWRDTSGPDQEVQLAATINQHEAFR